MGVLPQQQMGSFRLVPAEHAEVAAELPQPGSTFHAKVLKLLTH